MRFRDAALPDFIGHYEGRLIGGLGQSSSRWLGQTCQTIWTGVIMRFLIELLMVIAVCNLTLAHTRQTTGKAPLEQNQHRSEFQVFEFRRYAITEGEREHFAQYFESYFPEAFQQLGAIAAGSFFE